MEEIVDLSKNDVTQKPREGQIRRDEVQWTAMSISFKLEMVFTLDNFGDIIIMGFKPKGGLNPSSQFHSVNAIQHN